MQVMSVETFIYIYIISYLASIITASLLMIAARYVGDTREAGFEPTEKRASELETNGR